MRKHEVKFAGVCRLLILGAAVLAAQGARAASVDMAVGKTEAKQGEDVTIPVSMKGASKTAAMQMDLVYDPAILEAGKIDNGPLLADNCLMETNTATAGRIRLALVSKDGINGDGVLFNANFKVRGAAGAKCALTLDKVRVWMIPKAHENMPEMQHLIDVKANTQPGEVAISSGLPRWVIAAAAIAVVLIILLILKSRKKTAATAPRT